ncbi:cation:proton antiporter [Longimicrobium sp.]|uniref:cation:proton antiporter domain-containing protein n=1 Tax=Longimicrobium sp. TaxID=2029185 RepID=UPI002C53DD3F|nr:cation:proton antiporter [Longimicrobium sp.]HSU13863.1 cation:proton antiporter [Longimicrobium sp.]
MLLAAPLTLPFTDPVLVVATATLVFLVVPLLFERFRIPGIIGLIVAGAAIGPHGAGLLARSNTIVLLGTVGLLYLMLLVGLELDLHQFARYRARSLGFGTLSFLLPGMAGMGMAMALGYALPSALLIGSVFSSHTLLAYPIASRLGIVRNAAVTAALGGTILTEVLALLVLAIVVKSRGGALDAAFWLGLAIPFAVYVAAVMLGLPRLGRWFFRTVDADGTTEFIFVLAALFVASYTAHFGGVEPIIGALLAGLALNRLIPAQGALMSRIHFAGNAIFIPFFLLSVGMLVDARALQGRAVGIAAALTAGVVASKWLASFAAEKVFGWTADEGWTVFGLTVPHAAGTLAIVLVGFDAGLLDQAEVNGVVLMILVTCLAGPWAVERYGRRVALREEQRPYDPRAAPRRIVVSLSKPETADTLMDLAFILRGAGTDEPVHPLMVVRGEGSDAEAEAEVAEAEKVLAHAVVHAAAAEVPVVPLTRVDPNVAAGIARGVAETRGSLVVLGWNARRGPGQALFGGVLDQLLQRTRQAVAAARLTRPVNTAGRVVLVLPPAIERHPGFGEALRTVNLLATGAGAQLAAVTIGGEPERLKALHAPVKPALPAAWERVEGWGELLERVGAMVRPSDLVVLASARRGTLAWHPRLVRLPEQLAALVPGSLLLLYPAEPELAADGAARISDTVAPERVVRLGAMSFVAAVGRLLEGVFDGDVAREVANVVVRNEQQFSSELVPGVVLPHVRLKGLARPVLLLGVSREGVEFPRARHPARLIFLLVSPAERADEHLQMLAEVARLLSAPERVREMIDRFAPGTELDWLHVDD